MTAVDTSVVVAAFASWHEGHASAVQALGQSPDVPGHVLVEAFSVLTRLPPPHRAAPALVHAFLKDRFKNEPLVLPVPDYGTLVALAAQERLTGGAIYDALIAMTARVYGATLLTRDRRAVATYQRVGVTFEVLA